MVRLKGRIEFAKPQDYLRISSRAKYPDMGVRLIDWVNVLRDDGN